MDRLLERLDRWATGRNVLLLGVVVVLFSAVILPAATSRIESYSGGVEILDLELHFSAAEAYSRIEAYGPRGRRLYAWTGMTLDVVYPAAYAAFLSLLALYFLRRGLPGAPGVRKLALVPFLALVADILENSGIAILLVTYPTRLEGLAAVVGTVTTTKWLFVALSAAVVTLAAMSAFVRWMKPG